MRGLIIIILSLFTISSFGQIVGNKIIETKSYPLKDIYRINIQMYAKVNIDMDEDAGITIIGESNLLDLIGRNSDDGVLTLDQKEWIEPTRDFIINIGAPLLRELEMGTHDKTVVSNINGNIFKVEAPIGEVVLIGAVEELRIKSKMSKVDASKLIVNSASVAVKNDGEVIVNAKKVECDLNSDARFTNINSSGSSSNCNNGNHNVKVYNEENRYINLKIKNNNLGRNHFVVVGPKPDGRQFSYGFPLMPLQSKKERWTIGTKIYKENSAGKRTLLVTLTAEDENQTVNLFK